MALANPSLTVLAVTVSAGNQTLEKTLNNAIRVLTLLNRSDIAVARGACKPLARDLITAASVHGESGLDGPELPCPGFDAEPVHAWELIARKIRSAQSQVTLVPTGPLTNTAIFLKAYPELGSRIERIVLMGSSAGPGNWSAAAEFNIFVDPEAADIVFNSGIPLVMVGLDLTHRAQIMQEDIARISAIPNKVARSVADMLNFYAIWHKQPRWGFDGVPLHDPCTIAYLLRV